MKKHRTQQHAKHFSIKEYSVISLKTLLSDIFIDFISKVMLINPILN